MPEERILIEKIQDACKSEGMKILLEDMRKHKIDSDTIKIMPIFDNTMKVMLSSQSDEMLKRIGYVSALEWAIGLIEHYQTWNFDEDDDASI